MLLYSSFIYYKFSLNYFSSTKFAVRISNSYISRVYTQEISERNAILLYVTLMENNT